MASKFSSRLKPEFRSLDLDKTNNITYFEELIYGGFRVNIMEIISLKAQLSKAFHIQPSELDKMPFWELRLYITELEKLVKEENETQKSEMDKSGIKDAKRFANPNNMQNMMKVAQPKMPQMNFKMPSFGKM